MTYGEKITHCEESSFSELKLRRKMMINVCNLSSNCHLDLPLAVGGGQKIMRTKKW